MAKFRNQKNSLVGGEISPTALGRTDLAVYAHSCETLQNMIPLLTGGAYKRPGTIWQGQIAASILDFTCLTTFYAASGAEFILAIGTGGIKAYAAPTGSSERSIEVTVTGDSPSPVANVDDPRELRFAQSGDTLFCVHREAKPFIIQWNGSSFTVGSFDSTVDTQALSASRRDAWPYKAMNISSVSINANSATATGAFDGDTIYGAEYVFQVSSSTFTADDIGAVVKVYDAPTYGSFQISEITTTSSPQLIKGRLITPFTSTNASTQWWKSAWSDRDGWPSCVEFYESRLVYAGTDTFSDSLWFSETNDYFQLSKANIVDPEMGNSINGNPADVIALDPFTFTFASGRKARITWMKAAKGLLVGTKVGEHILNKLSADVGLWVETATQSKQSDYGSNGVIAYDGTSIFFCSASGEKVRSLVFNWQDQAYVAEEVQAFYGEFPTIGVNHRTIIQMAWDSFRSTLWCIDTAGKLAGFTYSKKLGINAWHSHELGRSTPVQSIAMLQYGTMPEVRGKALALAVYTAAGGYIYETMSKDYPRHPSIQDPNNSAVNFLPVYTDHTYIESVAQSLSGGGFDDQDPSTWTLQTGMAGPYRLVAYAEDRGLFGMGSSSTITNANLHWESLPGWEGGITGTTYLFHFGNDYTAIVKPVRIEAGSVVGSSQGAMKRVHKIFVRLFRTMSAWVGSDASRTEEIVFRTGSTPMGESAELFTGDKEILPESDYDRDGYVYIKSSDPLPMTVISISSEGLTYD